MDKNTLQHLKQDYINQLRELFSGDNKSVRNLDKVLNCNLIEDVNLGEHARTDIENNTIVYGPQLDIHHVYHELDHIRKGKSIYNNNGVTIPLRGIFFNEGITEWVATDIYNHSPYCQESKTNIGSSNYNRQMVVISDLSKKLGITPIELCRLIDLKHHFQDNYEIDDLFKKQSNGLVDFDEFQANLDFWGTWQRDDLLYKLGIPRPVLGDSGVVTQVTQPSENFRIFAEEKYNYAVNDMMGQFKTQDSTLER